MPLISDFGDNALYDELMDAFDIESTGQRRAAIHWRPFELLNEQFPGRKATAASDIWALSMVWVEVCRKRLGHRQCSHSVSDPYFEGPFWRLILVFNI